MVGQIVYKEKTMVVDNVLKKEISLESLPGGLYLVRLMVDDQIFADEIIIQR